MVIGIFGKRDEDNPHLLEDQVEGRFIAGDVGFRVLGRVTVPTPQIVVAENSLIFVNEGKIGAIVFGIVEDVNEGFFFEGDSDLKAISPSFDDRKTSLRKDGHGLLSDSVLKLREFLSGIHSLRPWLGLAKFPYGSQEILFLHLPSLPLHKVTFDLMGVLIRNSVFLPGMSEVGKSQAVLRLKAAKCLITGSKLVLKACSGQVFQFRFQIHPWGEVLEYAEESIAEQDGWHGLLPGCKPSPKPEGNQETL
jgi:hypothetical protein